MTQNLKEYQNIKHQFYAAQWRFQIHGRLPSGGPQCWCLNAELALSQTLFHTWQIIERQHWWIMLQRWQVADKSHIRIIQTNRKHAQAIKKKKELLRTVVTDTDTNDYTNSRPGLCCPDLWTQSTWTCLCRPVHTGSRRPMPPCPQTPQSVELTPEP